MIPTDSAALRAKALLTAAQENNKPVRAFVGFLFRNRELVLGVSTDGGRVSKGRPRKEIEVTPTTCVEHLQQMLEDAWQGLRRDYAMQGDRVTSTPDRRHGWRSHIRAEALSRGRA